jgi:hypothetical protein
MPYGKKPVPSPPPGAPSEIDFDNLWELAYRPALEALHYRPVRADQDIDALIIKDMIERLYYSDLVIADMTTPNGNVYYEVGVRHACKPNGCVLLAASWARPLFDVDQMRRVTFPLASGAFDEAQAEPIRSALIAGIPTLRDGNSPVHQSLPGFPTPDPTRAGMMQRELEEWSDFQAQIRTVELCRDPEERTRAARALVDEFNVMSGVKRDAYVLAMFHLIRDHIGWQEMLDFHQKLPEPLRNNGYVREQVALAESKSGNHIEAVAALESLIKMTGETPERRGLIGGRYKKLAAEADARNDEVGARDHLESSINAYERGMMLELSGFYCMSNLARLYRRRRSEGDEQRAVVAQRVTVMACELMLERHPEDEWVRPTLLGAAFDSGDVQAAEHWCKKVKGEGREGRVRWRLDTTIVDLERSAAQAPTKVRRRLEKLVAELKALLP